MKKSIEFLYKALGISQKELISLIGYSEASWIEGISSNDQKLKLRLANLKYAILPLMKQEITPMTRLSSIRRLVFNDLSDNLDSVISALKQDKYQKKLLRAIAKEGYAHYLNKN